MLSIAVLPLLLLSALHPSASAAFIVPQSTTKSRHTLLSATTRTNQTPEHQHAEEVFGLIDINNSGYLYRPGLDKVLTSLDIAHDKNEVNALFHYLDSDDDGKIDFENDFAPWYDGIISQAAADRSIIQTVLTGRRTVRKFDKTRVCDDVALRAVQCAIMAPNLSQSESWRFRILGPKTLEQVAALKLGWDEVPGWCVVSCEKTPGFEEQDYAATCCAVQNFMMSMFAEGVGTKWTSGEILKSKEFADIVGIDMDKERVVGSVWYGFASGGLNNVEEPKREKTAEDVTSFLP